ncbi:MAG: DUF560 domain-containing protein [Magnetococcales bacterium]|nr:DUF560 domain-containing protein [Magnetococcales bacterium]MBF0439636.1 DUF560 domain-containing protein [Magnetococcales bacterium]
MIKQANRSCKHSYWVLSLLLTIGISEAESSSSLNDDRDRQILEKLTPAQLQEFDAKLREAMTLYYENGFSHATPLFQEIAIKVDTLDVLYWYGKSALGSGAVEVAITKFQEILTRNPALSIVRLDLALAYLRQGNKEAAQEQLTTLKASQPSEEIQSQLAMVENAMNQSDKDLFVSLGASIGLQSDSNINARANDLPVGISTEKVSGVGLSTTANANVVYSFDKSKNYLWSGQLSHFNLNHQKSKPYDYSQVDINTGPRYMDESWRLDLPVGYVDRRYGHAELSESWYAAPTVTYKIQKDLDLTVAYRFEDEKFNDSANAPQDNKTYTFSIKPSLLFPSEESNSKQLMVASLLGGVSHRDAEANPFSYDEWNVTPSLFMRFDSDTETLIQAQLQWKNYDGNIALAGVPPNREDRKLAFNATLKQPLMDHFSASLSYGYTDNNSNTALYEYNKHVIGLSFGTDWNY